MFDFLRGMKRTFLFLLVLGCSFLLGCKSPQNQAEEQHAAAKKARTQGAEDTSASAASQARGDSSGGADPSGYQRTKTQSANNESDQEGETKENLEGGDPSIFHPPVHKSQAHEKIVVTKTASTPTPTPNRPIDRPLDPSGHPLASPTPGG
jgi:hypothetical protein